jgi:hypothetical protein
LEKWQKKPAVFTAGFSENIMLVKVFF